MRHSVSLRSRAMKKMHAILQTFCKCIFLEEMFVCQIPLQLFTIDQIHTVKTSNIRRTPVGNKIVDHSDVVGASPVGAAPTTSSFLTLHLPSRDSAKTATRKYENVLRFGVSYIRDLTVILISDGRVYWSSYA